MASLQWQCPTAPPLPYGPTVVHADKGDGTPLCGQPCKPVHHNGVEYPSVLVTVTDPATCQKCLGY
jgi:hypothetical protein